jgi:hypothetical protein
MDCEQFGEILPDLNRPGTSGMALRESALAHAESCSRCARLLTETESLDRALRALAAVETGLRTPARVEANLLREFRRRKSAVSRRRVRWQAATGIAAAILLALLVSLRHRVAQPSGSGSMAQVPAAGPVFSPPRNSAERSAPAAIQPQALVSAAAEKRGRSVQAAPSNEPSDSEDATVFIPLPYADDPTSLDDGAVVRVVMPRAVLASFGMPVAAMEGDGTVRADLIVSADGTPQAIRLVSQDDASRPF